MNFLGDFDHERDLPVAYCQLPFPKPEYLYLCAMAKIKVKIVNQSTNPLPQYATAGSAGMDIRVNLNEPVYLNPLERKLFGTGLFIELPKGYEGQVRPRSGLAIKYGLTCLNSPGTIDSDYRGEIKVILINLSQEMQVIQPGERIAQLIIHAVQKVKWKQVELIEETGRNDGGFGHTGKK